MGMCNEFKRECNIQLNISFNTMVKLNLEIFIKLNYTFGEG